MDSKVNRSQKINGEGGMCFHMRKQLPAVTELYKLL